jgi:sec-independent protein translocase protein TatA
MVAEIFGLDGIVVLVVVLALLFGSSQIPKLARSIGSARKEFDQALREREDHEPSLPQAPEAAKEAATGEGVSRKST